MSLRYERGAQEHKHKKLARGEQAAEERKNPTLGEASTEQLHDSTPSLKNSYKRSSAKAKGRPGKSQSEPSTITILKLNGKKKYIQQKKYVWICLHVEKLFTRRKVFYTWNVFSRENKNRRGQCFLHVKKSLHKNFLHMYKKNYTWLSRHTRYVNVVTRSYTSVEACWQRQCGGALATFLLRHAGDPCTGYRGWLAMLASRCVGAICHESEYQTYC